MEARDAATVGSSDNNRELGTKLRWIPSYDAAHLAGNFLLTFCIGLCMPDNDPHASKMH